MQVWVSVVACFIMTIFMCIFRTKCEIWWRSAGVLKLGRGGKGWETTLTGMAPQECFPASNKYNLWQIDKFTDLPGFLGFLGGTSGKEPSCQCRRCGIRSLGWEDPLEEEMATRSRILAWSIPWTEEPGGLQSVGSQRVRHDWSDLARCTPEFPPWLRSWKTKSHNPPPALSTLFFLCCN